MSDAFYGVWTSMDQKADNEFSDASLYGTESATVAATMSLTQIAATSFQGLNEAIEVIGGSDWGDFAGLDASFEDVNPSPSAVSSRWNISPRSIAGSVEVDGLSSSVEVSFDAIESIDSELDKPTTVDTNSLDLFTSPMTPPHAAPPFGLGIGSLPDDPGPSHEMHPSLGAEEFLFSYNEPIDGYETSADFSRAHSEDALPSTIPTITPSRTATTDTLSKYNLRNIGGVSMGYSSARTRKNRNQHYDSPYYPTVDLSRPRGDISAKHVEKPRSPKKSQKGEVKKVKPPEYAEGSGSGQFFFMNLRPEGAWARRGRRSPRN